MNFQLQKNTLNTNKIDFNNRIQSYNYNIISQQNIPLDQVLKSRNIKKHQKQLINSQQQNNNKTFQPHKKKPISKDKKQPPKNNPLINQMNSNDISERLVNNQNYTDYEIRQFLTRAGEIRSLKYDKFTDKIKNNLEECCCFQDSMVIFEKIMVNYDSKICSTFLIQSIYRGFQSFWLNCNRENINNINQLLNFYEKIPNCLNKIYLSFLIKLCKKQQNIDTYKSLRKTVYRMVVSKMKNNEGNQQQNQKIVGFVFSFNLQKHVDMKQVMKMVQVKKINEYIDQKVKKQYEQNQKKIIEHQSQNIKQKQNITSQSSNLSPINSLISSQIHLSIQQNNDKQVLRLIKLHKLPIQHFPIFLDRLQYKYLYHVDRQPIYVIDFLLSNKPSLIVKMIQIYRKKKKYRQVDHFVNKFYRQLGNSVCENLSKILFNPLVENDTFGPTESHVLKENERYFHLNQVGIERECVYVINSDTIGRKKQKDALIELLNSKQIGLDSQTRSGIHVLDKTVLQIIQIYCPRMKKVFLFDVQDLKNNNKQKYQKNEYQNINLIDQDNKSSKQKPEDQISSNKSQKSWTKMCKIITIIFKRCTIYGHALHSDLMQIIECLSLDIKQNQLQIKDSQVEFKKQFPKQTKSNLLFLSEFCFNKKISKFEQCSAWDYRPLRQAQIHYAAMDAVIPHKLVKWIQDNKVNKSLMIIN